MTLSQNGQALGDGQLLTLEAGHRLFADQMDHVIKLGVSIGQFSANNNLDPALVALIPVGQIASTAFFTLKTTNNSVWHGHLAKVTTVNTNGRGVLLAN